MFNIPLLLFLSSLFIHATLGEIVCEQLPDEVCAFSVSSSGKRCLLETVAGKKDGKAVEHQCRTSAVVVEKMAAYIETDKCIKACGVDRSSLGISSDTLLDPKVLDKLCSPDCYHQCPNIMELYFNMAVGEGVFLPYLCEKHRFNPHRTLEQLSSYGEGLASGPVLEKSRKYLHSFGAPGPVPSRKSHHSKQTSSKSGSPFAQGPISKELSQKFHPSFGPVFGPGSEMTKELSSKILSPLVHVFAPSPMTKEFSRKFLSPFAPVFAPSPKTKKLSRKFLSPISPVFAPGPTTNKLSRKFLPPFAPVFAPNPGTKELWRKFLSPFAPVFSPSSGTKKVELARKFLPPFSPAFAPGPTTREVSRKFLPPFAPIFAPGPVSK